MPYRRAIVSARAALALVLTTAACAGGSAGDAAGPAASSPDGPTSAAPSSAPSSEVSPSPTPASPSPSPDVLSAADKKRYKACRDGDCEVLVTEGTAFPINPDVAGGMETVTVTDVDGDVVGVDFDGPGIYIHLDATAEQGGIANGLALRVVAVREDEAVIRLGE